MTCGINLMVWNVYDYDINRKDINLYNVFKHHSFKQDVEELLKGNLTFNKFSKRLKNIAQYYFWSKAEYEIVITSWLPYIDNKELDRLVSERENCQCRLYDVNLDVSKKIDIYNQLVINWDVFAAYVYSFKKI